jgi:hypothetical protein
MLVGRSGGRGDVDEGPTYCEQERTPRQLRGVIVSHKLDNVKDRTGD